MGYMVKTLKMFDFGSWEEATSTAGKAPTTTKWIDRAREDDDGRLDRAARCGWSVRRLAVAVLCLPGDSLSLTCGWGVLFLLGTRLPVFHREQHETGRQPRSQPVEPRQGCLYSSFPMPTRRPLCPSGSAVVSGHLLPHRLSWTRTP